VLVASATDDVVVAVFATLAVVGKAIVGKAIFDIAIFNIGVIEVDIIEVVVIAAVEIAFHFTTRFTCGARRPFAVLSTSRTAATLLGRARSSGHIRVADRVIVLIVNVLIVNVVIVNVVIINVMTGVVVLGRRGIRVRFSRRRCWHRVGRGCLGRR